MALCLTCRKQIPPLLASIDFIFCSHLCAQDGYLILQRDSEKPEAHLQRQIHNLEFYQKELRDELRASLRVPTASSRE
jgi:hypothetical protein